MAAKKSSKASLAKRYAIALFALAQESDNIDGVEKDLGNIGRAIDVSVDLQSVIKNPVLSKQQVTDAFLAVVKNLNAIELSEKFCRLLGESRRLALLPDIVDAFQTLAADARGEMRIEVTTAVPLNDNHKNGIAEQLKKVTGKEVDFTETLDETILGGIIIKMGSIMLDDSLNGKLERLRVLQKQAALPS